MTLFAVPTLRTHVDATNLAIVAGEVLAFPTLRFSATIGCQSGNPNRDADGVADEVLLISKFPYGASL